MVVYILSTLILIGVLWLVFSLGRVAFRALVLTKVQRETARSVASAVVDAASEPGGSPDNPIPIHTPSVVEAEAAEYSCPLCETQMTVFAHRAEEIHGRRLRVAQIECKQCEHRRNVYFELKRVN